MDEEYDTIVLGTGLIECVLSGLLSVSGKKVLHTDRNSYYGGESTSFFLDELYKHFNKGNPPERLGKCSNYHVDLILKLILAHGEMVEILTSLGVEHYLTFRQLEGSFVYRSGKLYKVPVTEKEVLSSFLIGLFQKKYLYNLLSDLNKSDIQKGILPSKLTAETTMAQVYDKYGINDDNKELIGHVIALYQDDEYLKRPCIETFKRMNMYKDSLEKFGTSPYIYPHYGLGELPQAFARLASVYGGTYMLNTKATGVIYDDMGKVCGVQYGEQIVKTRNVIGDPSYFPEKVKKINQAIRCICILEHPVSSIAPIENAQIIIPAGQMKRKSDIYVSVISSSFEVSPKGVYIAIVATILESSNPEMDIKVGLDLLSPITEKFLFVSDIFEPIDDGTSTNVFVSSSYDATTHYESAVHQIKTIWKNISGTEYDKDFFIQKTKRSDDN